MTKFCLYYGVKPDGSLETIMLGTRQDLAEIKSQCKADISKLGNEYDFLVVATDYGVEKKFKTEKKAKAAPKKKTTKKAE